MQLSIAMGGHVREKGCRAYSAPMDLTFEADVTTKEVVQPDLFVMCGEYDRDNRIVGVPSLVAEILSPSTASHDFVRKMNLYQRVGVPEYWIVDPVLKSVNVYRHDGASLKWQSEYAVGDTLSPSMFPDLSINVRTLFE